MVQLTKNWSQVSLSFYSSRRQQWKPLERWLWMQGQDSVQQTQRKGEKWGRNEKGPGEASWPSLKIELHTTTGTRVRCKASLWGGKWGTRMLNGELRGAPALPTQSSLNRILTTRLGRRNGGSCPSPAQHSLNPFIRRLLLTSFTKETCNLAKRCEKLWNMVLRVVF